MGGFHRKVMVFVVEVSFNSHTVFVPIVKIYPSVTVYVKILCSCSYSFILAELWCA